jgi:hypothetical protein
MFTFTSETVVAAVSSERLVTDVMVTISDGMKLVSGW